MSKNSFICPACLCDQGHAVKFRSEIMPFFNASRDKEFIEVIICNNCENVVYNSPIIILT